MALFVQPARPGQNFRGRHSPAQSGLNQIQRLLSLLRRLFSAASAREAWTSAGMSRINIVAIYQNDNTLSGQFKPFVARLDTPDPGVAASRQSAAVFLPE